MAAILLSPSVPGPSGRFMEVFMIRSVRALLLPVLSSFALAGAPHAAAGSLDLPAGTIVPVRFETTVSSATSRPGDTVLATVRSDVRSRGRVVIPAGSEVRGHVVSARRPGKVKGEAYLAVRFDSVSVNGRRRPLSTGTLALVGRNRHRKDAALIGGGAGAGAIVGGLIDGKEGAAKGALIGGAAGTGAVLTTRGGDVAFPAGARYRLRVTRAS
jgi:hypothetical protein